MDIVIYVLIGLISIVLGVVIDRNLLKKSLNKAVEENQNKIKGILEEAENKAKNIVKNAENEKKDKLLEAKEEMLKMKGNFEEEMNRKKNQIRNNENKLKQREQRLNKLQEENKKRENEIDAIKDSLLAQSEIIQKRKDEAEKLRNSQVKQLEKIANLTEHEAKSQLLEALKGEVKSQASSLAKDMLEEAKLSATKAAKKVVIETIQRTATEHAIENCVSVFHIESDDIKGKIIGREGRNIRALEAATGVEIIVDDTPEAIIISGFDPVRREVARISLHRLVTDGRIHPARIEEVVAKTTKSLEEQIVELGERTVIDLGIHGLHPELIKMVGRMRFRSSYGQNLLQHSREVANLCAIMASELGLNAKLAKRAGLLHDIGKVYPDQPEAPHAIIGMELAKKYKEHPDVCNAIGAHHDEIEMKCLIAPIIQACDAISGSRPGARREVMDSYIKRLKELEDLAVSFDGVNKCYAIQAGRELRVIVDSANVNDEKAGTLSYEISQKIEQDMQYPGQIKITVIRETRAVNYAK